MSGVYDEKQLISVVDLKTWYPIREGIFQKHKGDIKAVDGVSFSISKGETLGLVGESGSGKSTLGRSILQLYKPKSGKIFFESEDLTLLSEKELRKKRREMQIIFQDPYASFNPKTTVGDIIKEPLIIHNIGTSAEKQETVNELLNLVGLEPSFSKRFPKEFSGGQRQRIGIARALALSPKFIVCDEPVSALDVSIQAQIISLLEKLQKSLGLTYLFIAHDIAVVQHISDRIAVMYLGKFMELTTWDELYRNPLHPYTQGLLAVNPIPDPVIEEKRDQLIVKGDIPSPANPPQGCNFSTRCSMCMEICKEIEPEWREISPDHWVACHRL